MCGRLAAAEASEKASATPKELSAAPAAAQLMLEGILENLSIADADAAEGRARRILGGLGFSARMQDGPLLHLSGAAQLASWSDSLIHSHKYHRQMAIWLCTISMAWPTSKLAQEGPQLMVSGAEV